MTRVRNALAFLAMSFVPVVLSVPAGVAPAQAPPADSPLQAAPQQEAYWWQDEIRTVAFALSRARSGVVSRWPQMTVAAGSLVLPLPQAGGSVTLDGNLDEGTWANATSFPVGPLFAPWREGPFMLQVLACRDDKKVYLAIQSPRDLRGLGALTGPGELFEAAGSAFRVEADGKIASGACRVAQASCVIEMAIPLDAAKGLALSFTPELCRLSGGKLPPELHCLGLSRLGQHKRPGGLWLAPIDIHLVPAEAAVQLTRTPVAKGPGLSYRLSAGRDQPLTGEVPLQVKGEDGVLPYRWQAKAQGKDFKVEGFLYVEPTAKTLSSARDIAGRAIAVRANDPAFASLVRGIAPLEEQARNVSPQDCPAWRRLYCQARALRSRLHLSLLDAPLLFVKQHPYFAAHIYDTYYNWRPGGGIYMLENPSEPWAQRRLRAVIDPQTKASLGGGVYRDPDVSWDGKRILFAYRGGAKAVTSIYEIGLDGRNLRRLTRSEQYFDVSPAYLPNDQIVFTSTRPKARVPCFNSGVDTLHVMNADGSDIRSISVNNVTEFDPAVMSDGRILYGRWEYVDKTALYMQSLWTSNPDGSGETAFFANNLAKPTAVLDARPVPGTRAVVASLTPHNGQPVGAIAIIDPECDKNDLDTLTNLTPEYPAEMDQGLTVGPCDPYPLSSNDVLISNNAIGAHGIIELIDRFGGRELVHCDAEISCYSPMSVKPRARPPVLPLHAEPMAKVNRGGYFVITDIYQGLKGVPRGTVKRLRVLEETARTSEVPPRGRWWNQAFLVSWQGAYIVKNFLGVVPVEEDGSAYFEAPAGRALYFEALDADGREVQRMRTFVQAAPGVTRSCIGCHEHKQSAPPQADGRRLALRREASRLEGESWSSGFLDYPTMVQPILDRHCVACHGGAKDVSGGIDLTGGWTWAFNISYETLLKNNLVGFLRCNNADVTSSVVLPPRTIGSGAAPLGNLLLSGHKGRIEKLTRPERDLLMAWMDSNSNYYGTWDYTQHAVCDAILGVQGPLAGEMRSAGCTRCHQPNHVGSDWVNLQTPEFSRVLRAPVAKSEGGPGLARCRDRNAPAGLPLVTQALLPPDVFHPLPLPKHDQSGLAVVTFASTQDPRCQAMLEIIRQARSLALAQPRVDMPGAKIIPGICRAQAPIPLPQVPPSLDASLGADGSVELSWQRTAETIGLLFELHRGERADFVSDERNRICQTTRFAFTDNLAPGGQLHYALVMISGQEHSHPVRASITVPPSAPPPSRSRPRS